MNIEYGVPQWRDGYHSPVAAKDAHEVVEKVRKANSGNVSAEDLVEAARPKRNKLHKAFTWDDAEAGAKCRLAEARNVMNALHVVRAEATNHPARKCEHRQLPPRKGETKPRQVYSTTEDVLKDPDARADLLKRAIGELVSCQHRYRGLQELAGVFKAVDEVLETYAA